MYIPQNQSQGRTIGSSPSTSNPSVMQPGQQRGAMRTNAQPSVPQKQLQALLQQAMAHRSKVRPTQ